MPNSENQTTNPLNPIEEVKLEVTDKITNPELLDTVKEIVDSKIDPDVDQELEKLEEDRIQYDKSEIENLGLPIKKPQSLEVFIQIAGLEAFQAMMEDLVALAEHLVDQGHEEIAKDLAFVIQRHWSKKDPEGDEDAN